MRMVILHGSCVYISTVSGICIVCEAVLVITLYCSRGAGLGVSVGAEVLTRAPLVEACRVAPPDLD